VANARWHLLQDELTYHIVSVCCEKLTFGDSLVKYHDFGLYGFKVKLQVVKRQYLCTAESIEPVGLAASIR
jgi:hypothetical protein